MAASEALWPKKRVEKVTEQAERDEPDDQVLDRHRRSAALT
jgi:hypothetical protein